MIVGISGHQDLGPAPTVHWVQSVLSQELSSLPKGSGLSSLAAGADQLFARVVLGLGWEFDVVVPCQGYEATFSTPDTLVEFRDLRRRARQTQTLPFDKPSENAFWQAGMYVVDHCDFMVFVWDGKPARGFGGTADVVKYALQKRRPYLHVNPTTSAIERFSVA